ncbi:unnamed protein product [Penicillium egyptiacum]|uniref:Uncharacterized protein n=1 Tax=Penicillium egyptiacum TaxID=1303716 RepID=A0A9W4K5J6_9EURO|nr:unnamed protein product [Penicillium egyptiacum]
MSTWAALSHGGPQPPQENIDKWEKAANENDSSILTNEDCLEMLRRWPLDQANYYCNFYVGCTIDELVQKAAKTDGPDNLTEAEAIIILNTPFGGCVPEDQKYMGNYDRWSDNTKTKFENALNLILAEMDTEKRARANADIAFERVKDTRRPELKNFSRDELLNIVNCNKIAWVKALQKHLEEQPAWGFVCIRTSFGEDSSWEKFKEFFVHATQSALAFPRNSPSIRPRWRIQWVEDRSMENASAIDLCSYFRRFCKENKVEPGLRHDAFLYANGEAIESVMHSPVLPSPAFVIASEAAYDGKGPEPPIELADYAGSVRVAIPHVYTTFWARLLSTEEDIQQKSSPMQRTWGEIFSKAQITREKTYPIKYFFMEV